MSQQTHMQPLLIELGTEELPVKALPGLAQAFFDGVIDGLAKRGIAYDRDGAKPLYTPRRLAVLLKGVATEQPEQKSEVLGPYLNIALDADGQPTKALQGFAAKAGIDWTQLEKTSDAKGERFVHRAVKPGAQTRELLQDVIRDALAAMPIPKPMRWGDHDYGFARPVHWLVVLLGKDVVDAEILGVRSDRMSRGHRFMHDKSVWFSTPDDYVEFLRGAKVLVDPDERRERIVQEVTAAASADGGSARIDAGILEEVNGLTEWPKAIACSFEAAFLAVPQEALIATMEANQKFFPVLDASGKLSERFIGIANIESRDESEVRKGYERVIRPRFADAKFFFVEDMKQGLASMNEGLKTVKYQDKLGTIADKVARVAALAETVAQAAGVDPQLARRAAELSKADLQSRLVNEFPELQGIAGRYYAAVENQPLELAAALDEAYMPRYAGDAIAHSDLGRVLAIAERLDTLASGFAAGLKPTGNKDPFALRRNALGLARTMIESYLDLQLWPLLDRAYDQAKFDMARVAAQKKQDAVTEAREKGAVISDSQSSIQSYSSAAIGELRDFIIDRLRSYYAEKSIPPQYFTAVEEVQPDSLLDFNHRLEAIGEFAKLPEAEALAAANKRCRNILRKADEGVYEDINVSLLSEGAERELYDALEKAIAQTEDDLKSKKYVRALAVLAGLRPQVDAFFDGVMVNVDDAAVRNNRLALLKRLSDRLGSVAAIEHLSI
ncbi:MULTISPECIES: glycine--tRNA ligase subunit beta [unclassified Lysobacter]|uniref:glycine--tRNA ligase subunit beta n=1 Tax=unclassified Lysobacter TaxID=2635362 RepID=UPI0006FC1AAA|nr:MULTISPECIES: glycine--tRNA ligase subunit beta [unclassified Lysobacter]KRC34648.1 glycine--tRNA ligase subunit beta [Lysobacter sp. Root76]KRD70337.1 glycine--tRNA ligase subunit beta [Lysobacter sp. Root96]